MLSHPDLSFSNILVDASGKVNAVIDWEGVMLHPPSLMTQYPLCLKSPERDYDGIMEDIEHDPDREEMLRNNIDGMILTRLRKVFRAELEELNSPYLRVFEEQSEFQDELYEMVWNRTVNQTRVAQWVEVQLEVEDDSDEYDEGSSMTDVDVEMDEIEDDEVGDTKLIVVGVVTDVGEGDTKDVEVDGMEDIMVEIECDDNRLAEEMARVEGAMARVEKDMSKTVIAKSSGPTSCKYCGHSP